MRLVDGVDVPVVPVVGGLAGGANEGPASRTPSAAISQRSESGTPDETTPQAKAHIGGNQVTGFNSSRTAGRLGSARAGRGRVPIDMSGA